MKSLLILTLLTLLYPLQTRPEENISKEKKNKIVSLTAKSYKKEISKGIVIVDYWAPWCGPCRKLQPVLKQISDEGKVKVAKINVDNYRDFANNQKVNKIPTLIIYKEGNEVQRLTGLYTKDELKKILNTYMEL